jgi:glycolate oxidase
MPCHEAEAHLIIQLEGGGTSILADDYERVGDLCLAHGALEVFVADNRNTREKLWKARKSVAEATWAYAPVQVINEDIVVPTSAVAPLMGGLAAITRNEASPCGLRACRGRQHARLLYLEEENASWEVLLERARGDLLLTGAGTRRDTHGRTRGRAEASRLCSPLSREAQMALIRRVKLAFDPTNILNPGRSFLGGVSAGVASGSTHPPDGRLSAVGHA